MKLPMNLPRVTVVTPSYNQGAYLEETICSVLDQDYPDIEYMVIDGGSTDRSVEVIRKYADRLAYWISEKDQGQADAINKGWRRATGEFVTWLNSDDLLLPGSLRHTAAALLADDTVDLVYGDVMFIDEHGRPRGWFRGRDFSLERLLLQWDNPIPQPGFLMRRHLLERVGFLDSFFQFTMDLDYWIRIALAGGKGRPIAQPVAAFRLHTAAKTSRAQLRRIQDRYAIYNKVFVGNNLPPLLRARAKASKAALHLSTAYIAYDMGDAANLRRYAGQHVALAGLRSSPRAWLFWLMSLLGNGGVTRLRQTWRMLRAFRTHKNWPSSVPGS